MILITGCSGYIGSQIAYILSKRNIEFIGIDNLSYSHLKNFKFNKKFYRTNISDRFVYKLIKKKRIQTVIHAAAYAYVNESEKNRKKYNLNNVKNTKKFINFCEKQKINNFIFLSSSNVYNDTSSVSNKNIKVNPKNTYGKNKLEIEKFLNKKKFKSKIILRLYNIIGMQTNFKIFKPKFEYQRIFFKFLDTKYKQKLKYCLKGNVKIFPRRDFLDIEDLGYLMIKIIKKLDKTSIQKIFNVGSGRSISVIKLYKDFKKLKEISKISYEKLKKEELLLTKADISKTKSYFKWRPRVSLNKSIRSLIQLTKI